MIQFCKIYKEITITNGQKYIWFKSTYALTNISCRGNLQECVARKNININTPKINQAVKNQDEGLTALLPWYC